MTEQSSAPEDEAVGPTAYFNSSFYMGDPSAYLRTRLHLLLLAAARGEELEELASSGLTFEGVTITPVTPDYSPDVDSDGYDSYVTTEVVLLHHHAAEAAIRLFVAHAMKPALPWVDLADRRSFWKFKKFVRSTFVDGVPDRAEVSRVCLGNRVRPDNHLEDDWDATVDGLTAFLRSMAVTFLDDAPVYNALKHGLRATPSTMSLEIADIQVGRGASITYPEVGNWVDDSRTWSLTTRWFDRTEAIGLIEVAIRMIDSIMRVGKANTAPPSQRPIRLDDLFFPTSFRPEDLQTGDRTGIAHRIRLDVLTERRDSSTT